MNPEIAPRYNLVVIGAGTAGRITAAGVGARVALVERHLMGNDCLNVGCVPSICVIRSSRVRADVANGGTFGVVVPNGTDANFGAITERMRRLRSRISFNDSAKRYTGLGVDIFLA